MKKANKVKLYKKSRSNKVKIYSSHFNKRYLQIENMRV